MRYTLLFLATLCSASPSFAEVITEAHLKGLLAETIREGSLVNPDFKYLKTLKIDVVPKLHEHAYYFQATPHHLRVPGGFGNSYYVEYNPNVLSVAPTDLAIKAILTHELFHVLDMENRSLFGNVRFGVGYFLGIGKVKYEHFTDERAVDMGVGLGLIEYRNWVYSRLTGKDLERKIKIYMTPEEIILQMNSVSP